MTKPDIRMSVLGSADLVEAKGLSDALNGNSATLRREVEAFIHNLKAA